MVTRILQYDQTDTPRSLSRSQFTTVVVFFLQENDLLIGEFVFQSNQSRCWKESKDIPTSPHVCGEGSCTSKLGIC